MKALVIADRRPATRITRILQQQPVELIITLGDLTRDDLLPLEHITDIPYGHLAVGRADVWWL